MLLEEPVPAKHFTTLKLGLLRSAIWLLLIAGFAAFVSATTAYVRVSQIGYEAGVSARAYLMASSAVRGACYKVINSSGKVKALGKAGAKLGNWGSYSVYPLDFTISAEDTYAISVSGPGSTTSPTFPVNTPANL